tara:strand:+ start:1878 stop:2330 length:453 start_codon:yes stop_codon:yes gene_type:complete
MLYFSNTGTTQTLTIWPEVSASIALAPSGGLDLRLVQDYDQSETFVTATIVNVPTQYNPRIIFTVPTAQLPAYGGLYSVYVREYTSQRPTWGNANVLWTDANWRWSDAAGTKLGITVIDTDRGEVQGTDSSTITQYQSPDETGIYITYHS